MRIGFDLDGVIACDQPCLKLPSFLAPITLLFFKKEIAGAKEALRKFIEHGDEVIIVTARPKKYARVTRWWLWLHQIPCAKLCVVWPWQKKLEILKNEQVERYFDDKQKIVDFLRSRGIDARLFIGWKGGNYGQNDFYFV